MKVHNPIGSKKRFVEIFERVNSVKLNENVFDSSQQNEKNNPVLIAVYNELKNRTLNIKQTNTHSDNDDSFVELICTDKQNNEIIFKFKVFSVEEDQEEVYDVKNVELISFIFKSSDDSENIELVDEALNDFNSEYGSELFDVIEDYIDIDSAEPEDYEDMEELAEAIKLIDAIKQDSYPYGGGNDRMQTGKAYANEKPTNPKLRIKTSELDKYIQENDENDNGQESLDIDIEQLANDKEEKGEILNGGKGDNKSPLDFNIDQVMLGLDVEKEHTDDPTIAIEIVLDHLSEDPEYYTTKEDPETSAQVNASADASEDVPHESGAFLQDGMPGEKDRNGHPIPSVDPYFMGMGSPAKFGMDVSGDDKEMTDLLLGYEPKNVGDSINNIDDDDDELNELIDKGLSLIKEYHDPKYDTEDDETDFEKSLRDKKEKTLGSEPYRSVENYLAQMLRLDRRFRDSQYIQKAKSTVYGLVSAIDKATNEGKNPLQTATAIYNMMVKRLTPKPPVQPLTFDYSQDKITGIANNSTKGLKDYVNHPRMSKIVPIFREEFKKLGLNLTDAQIDAQINDMIYMDSDSLLRFLNEDVEKIRNYVFYLLHNYFLNADGI